MAFTSFELTNEGINLLASVNANLGSLKFTRFKIGNGTFSGDIKDLTDVINEIKELNVTTVQKQPDKSVKVQGTFDNSGFLIGYQWREIGLYAQLGDTGTEILYSYSYNSTPDTIPAYDPNAVYRRTLDVRTYVGDTSDITFEIIELVNKYDFNTVAEMQAAPYLTEGDRVKLWGYYSLGDGGGHERVFSLTDNGTGIPFNGGFAIITDFSLVDSRNFGIFGDSITDNTQKIQDMFNSGVRSFFFSEGTYLVTGNINIPSFKEINGERGTVFFMEAASVSLFNITGTKEYIKIKEIEFKSNTTPTLGASSINSSNGNSDIEIYDCIFDGFSTGFSSSQNENVKVEKCLFKNMTFKPLTNSGGYGIVLENGKNFSIKGNTFEETVYRHHIYVSVTQGLPDMQSENVFIEDNNFFSHKTGTLETGYEFPLKIMSSKNVKVLGNTFDGGIGGVWFTTRDDNNNDPSDCIISNNTFINMVTLNSVVSAPISCSLTTTKNLIITDNIFSSNTTQYLILLEYGEHVSISDNNFDSNTTIEGISSRHTINFYFVKNNTIRNSCEIGIYLSWGNAAVVNEVDISENTISDCVQEAIRLRNVESCNVTNNKIKNSGTGIRTETHDGQISFNFIDSTTNGIRISDSDSERIFLHDNVILNASANIILNQSDAYLVKPINQTETNTGNMIVEFYSRNNVPPSTGTWNFGDRCTFFTKDGSGNTKAICTSAGTPGTWELF